MGGGFGGAGSGAFAFALSARLALTRLPWLTGSGGGLTRSALTRLACRGGTGRLARNCLGFRWNAG
ncbi:hypothetical protein AGMMS49992_14290 [Clostridia bacterium]|nr:hypothetical protein AGMMS49992_14290 [Clostridia bacterium]